ncbi:gluconokinase [Protaetiibacter mangrovi]|uniref:Gluconokinase n=1 Tax=Protaetiibacter mangrovi TaxID=2970926 RepID=A0ABT1ZFE0_9MICO|nr:gluconokinase [Protaetiibacter mangrovi]MCS0499427.1 gluconokinase [Protaetiibacter mangrovi]
MSSGPVVVMGVSGSGKSTVGALLAGRLGWVFVDGDELHPSANVAKMAAGIPLDDDDRWPWLDAVGERLAAGPVVVACSALRRAYRDRLRAAAPGVRFVLLDGTRELLAARMSSRHHFMPETLLDSQLATLERPDPDEHVLVYDIAAAPARIADAAARDLEGA